MTAACGAFGEARAVNSTAPRAARSSAIRAFATSTRVWHSAGRAIPPLFRLELHREIECIERVIVSLTLEGVPDIPLILLDFRAAI